MCVFVLVGGICARAKLENQQQNDGIERIVLLVIFIIAHWTILWDETLINGSFHCFSR